MNTTFSVFTRRHFFRSAALAASFYAVPGAYAEALLRTPAQTEGPFYPDHLPLDTDNDLIIVNNSLTPATGEVTYVSGRILGPNGEPVRGALVEIWQCDHNGVYLHSRSSSSGKGDPNFQGFGRFLTGTGGEYLFRTIKPVPYAGRTSHIHYKVKAKGRELLTTQCYVKGFPGNERDGIYKSIRDPLARESVTIDFAPLKGAKAGELSAKFDIVLGVTPES
jgi:protocatechuate 3,4-dioxygenase beta subunit